MWCSGDCLFILLRLLWKKSPSLCGFSTVKVSFTCAAQSARVQCTFHPHERCSVWYLGQMRNVELILGQARIELRTLLCKIQQMNVMVVTTHPLAFFSGEAIWWADGTTNCDMFELLFQGSNYQPCVFIERPSNGFVFSNGFLLFILLTVCLFVPYLLGGSGGVVNTLDFCPASLKSLGCFYFRYVLSSQWKAVTVNLQILHCQL